MLSGTPIGSSHDITTRWAGSALVPLSSRSRPVNSPTGSRLPPPPSYQVATQFMTSTTTDFNRHHHHHHQVQQQQHSPVSSAQVPVTSSFSGSLLVPHDRKMSFQIESSTWKDREPTHFRWNLMPATKTETQKFHHTLPTSYDEVKLTAHLSDDTSRNINLTSCITSNCINMPMIMMMMNMIIILGVMCRLIKQKSKQQFIAVVATLVLSVVVTSECNAVVMHAITAVFTTPQQRGPQQGTPQQGDGSRSLNTILSAFLQGNTLTGTSHLGKNGSITPQEIKTQCKAIWNDRSES